MHTHTTQPRAILSPGYNKRFSASNHFLFFFIFFQNILNHISGWTKQSKQTKKKQQKTTYFSQPTEIQCVFLSLTTSCTRREGHKFYHRASSTTNTTQNDFAHEETRPKKLSRIVEPPLKLPTAARTETLDPISTRITINIANRLVNRSENLARG